MRMPHLLLKMELNFENALSARVAKNLVQCHQSDRRRS